MFWKRSVVSLIGSETHVHPDDTALIVVREVCRRQCLDERLLALFTFQLFRLFLIDDRFWRLVRLGCPLAGKQAIIRLILADDDICIQQRPGSFAHHI